ncbi:MAG: L-serine ammonia-lyase, iron-sulfur-dependent, subunit alpha [Butyricimonas faecihominis]
MGILIAGTGAASAITYLMGGTYDNMVNTIKTMCSNLTGMMCDGAKQGCALKVYSGVSAAVQAALLSMRESRRIMMESWRKILNVPFVTWV